MTISRTSVGSRLIMSALLLTILGVQASYEYCNVWREIKPCSCKVDPSHITISCEKMDSFAQVVNSLQNKFSPQERIYLCISDSRLDDLQYRSFDELNMTITQLKLNYNNLRELSPYSFAGLSQVVYFSLADNPVSYIPPQIFERMPNIGTVDLGSLRVRYLEESFLKSFKNLKCLVIHGNYLERMDMHSIPSSVSKVHLGTNQLKDLNNTLRHLSELEWLFINRNHLTSLDNQLPKNGQKLKMIHASHNRIEKLPQDLKYLTNLASLFFHNNSITSLDGTLSKSRNLERLQLEQNRLTILQEDDFAEATKLHSLMLGYNNLTSLNNSIRPLVNLTALNLTHNLFHDFSFEELRGLHNLSVLDLSYNRINHLTGFTPNLIEWESNLRQLRLDHNEIHSLNGAVSGFRNLVRLEISYNKLTRISPDDLIGLDRLNMLDISHNLLVTLEETSKTFLPSLQELLASHNYLKILDRDFHGLPVLCWADLSHNQIIAFGRDLVSKTHCRVHDGIHSDVWGTLKIDLQDNPILCDAALPEIMSSMEMNHTKISGVANCPILSEQPVTSKRNGYLGYIPETTPSIPEAISSNLQHLNDQESNAPLINPLYSQLAYEPVNVEISNQVRKSIEEVNIQNLNNDHNQIQQDAPHAELEASNQLTTSNTKTEDQYFVPIQEPDNVVQNQAIEPIPYQRQNVNYLPGENVLTFDTPNALINKQAVRYGETDGSLAEQDLSEPVYANIDPILQEKQLSQLASEIEQLRTRVQELTSEHQRLAQNLHQKTLQNHENKIIDNSRPILPLEQVIISSTVKPPNEDFERTP